MSDVCEHGILLSKYRCKKCEAKDARAKYEAEIAKAGLTAPPTLQVNVFLKSGSIVQVPIPDASGFNFPAWCAIVRGDGAIKGDAVYIPWESILLIAIGHVEIKETAPKKNEVN